MGEADSEQIAHHLNARLLRFRSQPDAEDARVLAEDLISARRYGDARGVAVSAQPDTGDDGELLVIEGRAWFLERDLVRAQAALLKAVRVDPARAQAYRWLGEVLLTRGDPARAAKTLRRAIELDPSDGDAARLAARAEYLSEAPPAPTPAAPPAPARAPEPAPPPEPEAPVEAPVELAAIAGRPSPFPGAVSKPTIVGRPPPPPPPQPPAQPGPRTSPTPPSGLFSAKAPVPVVPPPSQPTPSTSPGATTAPGTLGAARLSPPGAFAAPSSPGTRSAPGSLPAPTTSPGVGSAPGTMDAPRTAPGTHSSPGSIDAPRTSPGSSSSPGSIAAPLSSPGTRSSPGSIAAPRTSPGTRSAPGSIAAPRTSPGTRSVPGSMAAPRPSSSPGTVAAPRTSPGAHSAPGTLDAPAARSAPGELDAPRTSPGTRSAPGSLDAPHSSPGTQPAPSYEGLATLSGDDAPELDEPLSAYSIPRPAHEDTRDVDIESAEVSFEEPVQLLNRDTAADDDGEGVSFDPPTDTYAAPSDVIEPGVPPERAPNLALGGEGAIALDGDEAFAAIRQLGLFEERDGTDARAEWSPESEVTPTGTPVRNWLIGAWLLTLALGGGGYFGWQAWIAKRHARAAELVAQASSAMQLGDHARMIDAERLLRMARDEHPASRDVPRAALLLHSERVLEDGRRDLSDLRAALVRARAAQVEPAALSVATAVVSSLSPDSPDRARDLQAATQATGSDAFLGYVIARLEQRLGKSEAAAQLTAAAQLDPKLAPAQLALAEGELEAGEREQALARIDAVLAAHPDHLSAQLLRAFASADDADPVAIGGKLDALAKQAVLMGPGDQLMLALTRARILRRQGKSDEAGKAIEAAGAAPVDEPRLIARVAREALALGKHALAQRTASQALSAAPDVPAYRLLLAKILLERGDGEHALQLLDKLGANDVDAQIMKAQAALASGEPAALRASFDALAAVQSPEHKTQLGALRIRLQAQFDPSPDLVNKAKVLSQGAPGDADALYALAEAALAAHDPEVATRALTQRAAVVPDDPNAFYLQGRARRMALDVAGAETAFKKALTLAPGHGDALSGLAQLYLDAGKYEEAEAVSETLTARGATLLEGRLGRIEALLGLRRVDDAQVQLDAIPEAQRNGVAVRSAAARVALARGKPGDALTLLRPLIDAPTKKPATLVLYGDALSAAEQIDAAAGAYDAALAQDAELPEALIGRAEIHLRAERPGDALSLLETAQGSLASRLRPPSVRSHLLGALGHAYVMRSKHGDLETARNLLREGVRLAGAPAETFFWLGESLAGKVTPEAKAAYQRYLALEPGGKYADRAKRSLGPLLGVADAPDPFGKP